MKIDRRSFLAFGIGGAAGTMVSPLPWKLMDDFSIWTQNWPWTPRPKRGEVTHADTICTLCPGGCGISVKRVGERAVKIEGMAGHPVNNGGVCLFSQAGLQFLYGETMRVTAPLARAGKRGEGQWRPISWESALDILQQKLTELRVSDQAHRVAAFAGDSRGTRPALLKRFLTAYGSPNFFFTPTMADCQELTVYLMQGADAHMGYDFAHSDFILSFGSGVLDGWGSPVRMFQAHGAWRDRQAFITQVEPRLSSSAAKADKWIAAVPGTEGILAMGICWVLVNEKMVDQAFIARRTQGFDVWNQRVLSAYTPARVSAATGLPESELMELARRFGQARHPVAICGRGQGRGPDSVFDFAAVHALNALVGAVNRKGGVWNVPMADYAPWPDVAIDDVALAGLEQPACGADDATGLPQLHRLPEALGADADNCPVQLLMVAGANPRYTLSNNGAANKALNQIPFVVSFSSFMDETAQQADLILPDHAFLERFEDVPAATGFNRPCIGLARPVVAPQFNTANTADVLIEMAHRLGGPVAQSFPWQDYVDCLEQTLADKWPGLIEKGYWVENRVRPGAPAAKFSFFNDVLATAWQAGPAEALEGQPGRRYALTLIPYDSMRIASGAIAAPPFAVKVIADNVLKHNDSFIEINPETAHKLGFSEGDYARVDTPAGSAQVRVHLFDGIMPGLIAMPRGLGHTAFDKYIAGKGVNVNDLLNPAPDPVSGFDAAWGIPASLVKA